MKRTISKRRGTAVPPSTPPGRPERPSGSTKRTSDRCSNRRKVTGGSPKPLQHGGCATGSTPARLGGQVAPKQLSRPQAMLRRKLSWGRRRGSAASFLPTRHRARAERSSRTLRFVPQADVTILDPLTTSAYVTRNHALLVFDQLFAIDGDLRPQPQRVEGYTAEEDGKRLDLPPREGLKFHDGEPVLRARLRRLDPAVGAARQPRPIAVSRTDAMEAPDDRSFTIRLNRPYGLMLATSVEARAPGLLILTGAAGCPRPKQQLPEVIGFGSVTVSMPASASSGRPVVYDRNRLRAPCGRGGLGSGRAEAGCISTGSNRGEICPIPSTAEPR